MVLSSISAYKSFHLKPGIPFFEDHCLFTNRDLNPIHIPPHHTGLGIIAVIEGKADVQVNNNRLSLDPVNFLIVNEGSQLSVNTTKNTSLVLLFFRSNLIDLISAELLFRNPNLSDNLDSLKDKTLIAYTHFANASIKDQLKQLISIGNSCASFQALKADAILRSLLTDISQENIDAISVSKKLKVIKRSTRVSLYQRLIITKSWMDKNFHQKIDLRQSAGMAMMNEEHFLRNFKIAFGITPHQYLMQLRLEESKRLLRSSNKEMTEISEHIGFEALSSFSYQFGKQEGMSPTDYRRKFQRL